MRCTSLIQQGGFETFRKRKYMRRNARAATPSRAASAHAPHAAPVSSRASKRPSASACTCATRPEPEGLPVSAKRMRRALHFLIQQGGYETVCERKYMRRNA